MQTADIPESVRAQPSSVSGRIRIGCAGWSIRSSHSELFDAGASQLARYATRFDCVEINSSFYRSHQRTTYARWAAEVPDDFRFSVKLPKTITHQARLREADALIAAFASEVEGLGSHLGGVLVQLPPSLAFDADEAGLFFHAMRQHLACELAVEPRHPSWFLRSVARLWGDYGVARVAADPPRFAGASTTGSRGAWRYWRWHGSPRIYWSAYDTAALRELADVLLTTENAGQTAWCIFDNTAMGCATTDAMRLQELIKTDRSGNFIPQAMA